MILITVSYLYFTWRISNSDAVTETAQYSSRSIDQRDENTGTQTQQSQTNQIENIQKHQYNHTHSG